jgi:hypothetical protein
VHGLDQSVAWSEVRVFPGVLAFSGLYGICFRLDACYRLCITCMTLFAGCTPTFGSIAVRIPSLTRFLLAVYHLNPRQNHVKVDGYAMTDGKVVQVNRHFHQYATVPLMMPLNQTFTIFPLDRLL